MVINNNNDGMCYVKRIARPILITIILEELEPAKGVQVSSLIQALVISFKFI